MVTRFALLLPLFAIVAVGVVGGALFFSSRRETPAPAAATLAPATSAAIPTPAGQPKLAPGQTVCQGLLHVPGAGEPRTFPAVYTQRVDVRGITVVGSANVSRQAFDEAKKTIERMFANNDLVEPLVERGAYVIIVDDGQGILSLPEFSCLGREAAANLISHACGIADRADYPVATVNEADLVGDRRGPCRGLNILYHELGHLVQNWSLPPADYFDIKQYYAAAVAAGKYKGQYAATNPNEYFAEATQNYFLHGDPDGSKDRAWLRKYDPDLYELLARNYGQ